MRDDEDAGPAPGLLILHGNRLELLLETVLTWLAAHPLAPLEEEVLLVQSNGIAEWLKMSLAQRLGVCAATRVELPARFLWRCYRAMLGRSGAPASSPLDKSPLVWRLMRLLPTLARQAGYEPLAQFLDGPGEYTQRDSLDPVTPDLPRRLQLAQRLADLYDQYQVYRADWLIDWADGRAVLSNPYTGMPPSPLDAEQRWQALLWQALIADLGAADADASANSSAASSAVLAGTRPAVHARFVAALAQDEPPQRPLPRRVVLFGHSHLPAQTLEALAALAGHTQVILAVPNPCRFHWADMIDGRELLRSAYRRLPQREGRDLAGLDIADAHAQAHPLLAAWGRQGRDFLRLLDAFEEQLGSDQPGALRGELPRVDLFDDAPGESLLAQVQARIRDAVPLAEHAALQGPPLDAAAAKARAATDRSIEFHLCHSAMREVEVLHDQLLARLAAAGGKLAPREIVVMVPDVEVYAPLVRAVFGQYPASDARHIPYDIADLRPRGHHPLLLALEWLLRITEQRCTASELRELVDVAALANRFGLAGDDLPTLSRWLDGAGVRWGLDAEHRASLDLAACGEANTWAFGLRRMLLGYAVGDDPAAAPGEPWHGIAPYAEVGGLDASIAGALAELVEALQRWWREARTAATPTEWDSRARALLAAFFRPASEDERLLLAALHDALAQWRAACDDAGYAEAVPLAVLREAWLGTVDEPGLRSRFLAGGVTFCTLMPMRAIPFQGVCLLGMNEGDYPRRGVRSDFDLLAAPGQRRPGDRARRDDDRMLMLEALLSARAQLHISWIGRSVRDNTAQPPSVLVAQLRDYLAAGWGRPLVEALSVEHPLQPFSRRYFEGTVEGTDVEASDASSTGSSAHPGGLLTYAREWRAAHGREEQAATRVAVAIDTRLAPAEQPPLKLAMLTRFLRNPVTDHLSERLGVRLALVDEALADDEPLGLHALDESILLRGLVEQGDVQAAQSQAESLATSATPGPADPLADATAPLQRWLQSGSESLQRQGLLPLAGLGERWQRAFVRQSLPMLAQWRSWQQAAPERAAPQPLHWTQPLDGGGALQIDDWLDGLQIDAGTGQLLWLDLQASRLCTKPTKKEQEQGQPGKVRTDKLYRAWLVMLSASACGIDVKGRMVGRDVTLELAPPPAAIARVALADLLRAWWASWQAPLPIAPRSALAALAKAPAPEPGPADTDPPSWPDDAWAEAERSYDGSTFRSGAPPEREEPALARVFADWEALAARSGEFQHWAEHLYRPLRDWALDAQTVEARLLPQADLLDDDTEDDDSEDA
jgi:exodeoxyribonuclease V gamma subunit